MDKYARIHQSKLDPDRIYTLKNLIEQSPPDGIMAEVGVYKGGTLRIMAEACPHKVVVGFDTFAGLPVESWQKDERHKPGEFGDTSYEYVTQQLQDIDNIVLVQGLFPHSAKNTVWEKHYYSFVHVDTDYYQSVFDAIVFFYPKMEYNGIILFDDYQWQFCPGVEKAIRDFGLSVTVVEHDYIKQAYWISHA